MAHITLREFIVRQPDFPKNNETDAFYLDVANELVDAALETTFGKKEGEGLMKHLALTLIGYYQDVISDMGLWRSFTDTCLKWYGSKIPFFTVGEEYMDYELNEVDVRFLTWYDIAMLDMEHHELCPHDPELQEMAGRLFVVLESRYEEAPFPVGFDQLRELDILDKDDNAAIYDFSHWLFNRSWLMTPAYALNLQEIVSDPEVMADKEGILLNKRLDEAMFRDSTGPLALYTGEWVPLIIHGRIPRKQNPDDPELPDLHPYYERFVKATDGKEIAFFDTYESMNRFFIDALGWEADTEHLPSMKGSKDFVLLVNKHKGMLMARNVARCIKSDDNPYYDATYARDNALDLLTVRGLCPHDLMQYIYAHDMLPDAHFPGSDDCDLVKNNHDFIARCYLQTYYRGD